MTDAQRARLPGPLRDIVDFDRDTSLADHLAGSQVVHISRARLVLERRELGASLRQAAHHLFGRTPLRGDTGPGRPTAAAA